VHLLAAGAAIGLPTNPSTRRPVPARARRLILSELRGNPLVLAATSDLDAVDRLDWRRARVTSPTGPGTTTTNIASIPGHGANLRVMLADRRPLVVIGENQSVIIVRSGRQAVVNRKSVDS
jgi:hypothetical protein